MSRPLRAGSAGKPVTIRATDGERANWLRATAAEGQATLSAWIVKTLNNQANTEQPSERNQAMKNLDDHEDGRLRQGDPVTAWTLTDEKIQSERDRVHGLGDEAKAGAK